MKEDHLTSPGLMRIGSPHAGRGHPPRAGPAPAVPPQVAGGPRGGRKRRLPLGEDVLHMYCNILCVGSSLGGEASTMVDDRETCIAQFCVSCVSYT